MADEQPTNPFESGQPEPMNGNGNGDHGETMTEGTPGVAAKAGKTYIVFGIIGLVVVLLLYSIFSGGDKKPEEKDDKQNKIQIDAPIKDPLPLPPPPPKEDPIPKVPDLPLPPISQPLPQPVAVPVPDNLNPLTPKEDAAAKAQMLARMKSSMLVKDGGSSALGGADANALKGATQSISNDPNSQFLANASSSKVEKSEATRLGNLRRTIAQGRIIQATLESAINTDLPAQIRAIVSIDTYAEAGTEPLIPKGSRLVGTYNTTLTAGQTRVFVVWTRVIRPDGVDVQLGSPLVDAIGQGGVAGQLDTKFQEIFSRSLLASVMNIATAVATDKVSGGGDTTTTTSTTGSQTSGDAITTATTNALNRLGATTDSFIQRFIGVPPTILVDQGTKVNVMVNKDLYFPEDTTGVRIVN